MLSRTCSPSRIYYRNPLTEPSERGFLRIVRAATKWLG